MRRLVGEKFCKYARRGVPCGGVLVRWCVTQFGVNTQYADDDVYGPRERIRSCLHIQIAPK